MRRGGPSPEGTLRGVVAQAPTTRHLSRQPGTGRHREPPRRAAVGAVGPRPGGWRRCAGKPAMGGGAATNATLENYDARDVHRRRVSGHPRATLMQPMQTRRPCVRKHRGDQRTRVPHLGLEPATAQLMLDRSWAPPRNALTLVQVAPRQRVLGRVLSRRGLAVLLYVSWQRAKDVAIRERSFSVSIYDAGDSEFVAVWLGCVGPGVPFVLEPGPTGWR